MSGLRHHIQLGVIVYIWNLCHKYSSTQKESYIEVSKSKLHHAATFYLVTSFPTLLIDPQKFLLKEVLKNFEYLPNQPS